MQWLNDLSVRNKISGNSLLLILLMLGSTLYAINSMRSIGSELEAIAEQDIPMTEVLTRITEHQLEQAIHFERAVRYAILLNRDDKAEEHFIKEVNYFNKLNAKVDKEILEGEDHATKAIENAHTDLEEQEFTRILAALKKIEAEHKEFAKHAGEAFTLYRTGRLAEAEKLTQVIEAEEDQLTRELEQLLKEIELFTLQAAENAELHEKEALRILLVIFAVSIVIAMGATWLTSSAVVKPLDELTDKLRKVGDSYDYRVRVNIHGKDEVGQAGKAFNQLMDAQQKAIGSVINVVTGLAEGVFGRRVTESLVGDLDTLKQGVNESAEVVEQSFVQFRSIMEAANDGDFSARLDLELKGELNQIKVVINQSLSTLEMAIQEIVQVAVKQREGDLGQRVNGEYRGNLRDLKQALNGSAESVDIAVNEITQLMDALKQGDFNQRITSDYQGDLNQLKQNVNDSIEQLAMAMDEIVLVSSKVMQGQLQARIEGNYAGKLKELKEALNQSNEATAGVLVDINNIMSALNEGQFDRRIERQLQGDLATLKENINSSFTQLDTAIGDIVQVASAQQQGDLSLRVQGDYQGQLEVLKSGINATAAQLENTISTIRTSADSVLSGSQEILGGVSDLSQRTEEQASSLEETASSMEQMASSVEQSSLNANGAAKLAEDAKTVAVSGGQIVEKVVVSMADIHRSSKEIGDIISVIDEIAFQTNLLALNAAVEAARAGEQGRGFAVVAGEVRALAQRSAGAAKQIKDLIQSSSNKVEEGTDLVNKAGNVLSEIIDSSGRVMDAVAEIRDSSREQNSGIQQVNNAVSQMDEITQQNAALVEEASAAMQSVNNEVEGMVEKLAFFQVGATAQSGAAAVTLASSTHVVTRANSNLEDDTDDDAQWSEF